jgi:preprotein translocase subunit YajC
VSRVTVRDTVVVEAKGEIAEYVAPTEEEEELFLLLLILGGLLYLAYRSAKAAAKPTGKQILMISDQVDVLASGEITGIVAEVIDEVTAIIRGILYEKYSKVQPSDTVTATSYGELIKGVVIDLFDTVSSTSSGEIIPPSLVSVPDTVSPTSTGSLTPSSTAGLSDIVSPTVTGSITPIKVSINISDTVSPSSGGYITTPAKIQIDDTVTSTATGFVGTPTVNISLFDTVSPNAVWQDSSGINPFNPLWTYQPTNTSIRRLFWEFYKSVEVQSFFTSTDKPSWYDDYALFDSVTAYRQDSRFAYVIVACVKPIITAITQETDLLYISIDDGATALRGAVLRAVNAQTLRIYDRGGSNYTEFSWNGDWIVVYVSWPEKVARVYDRNGNLLASRALEDYMATSAKYTVTGSSPNVNIKLMLDWVTISVP